MRRRRVFPFRSIHVVLVFTAPFFMGAWRCQTLHHVPIDHGMTIVADSVKKNHKKTPKSQNSTVQFRPLPTSDRRDPHSQAARSRLYALFLAQAGAEPNSHQADDLT